MKILDMKIVVGIPAYNEGKNIAEILVELKKLYQNIIVCDDGSKDLTAEIAEGLGAIVIKHDRNLGYGSAIKSIFLKAEEIKADVLITFDADGQHRIKDIGNVLEPIKENIADMVIGSRFLDNIQDIPKYRKVGIKAITGLTNISGGTKITDSQSGFRAYNKKILENIKLTESGMGISTEILIKTQKAGFRISEVPITVLYNGDTSTHNPVSHGISVIFSTIKFTFIERPLTFYGIPGIILFSIGLFFIVWTLQIFSETRQITTNIALIGIGSVMIGILFLMTSTILYTVVSVVREKRN